MVFGALSVMVLIVVGLCLIGGMVLIRRAMRSAVRCPKCRKRNERKARFCANCGQQLT